MLRTLLISLLLCCLTAAPAFGVERDLVVYCEYPAPTEFTPGDKGGLIFVQVWELMRRTGVTRPIETVSWKRGYAEATTRPNVALFPTTRTPQREELFHWIGPILRLTWAFYAHKDSRLRITSLEDAKNVRAIGTYAHDSKEQWLQVQGFTNLESVMDNVTNMRKLYDRRIDLMVGSPSVTDRWPDMFGFDPDKLLMAYPFKTVDLYLALSIDTPMDTVRAMEKAFADMIGDGTVLKQYNQWVPGLIPPTAE